MIGRGAGALLANLGGSGNKLYTPCRSSYQRGADSTKKMKLMLNPYRYNKYLKAEVTFITQ
jgi:hypothetical protein